MPGAEASVIVHISVIVHARPGRIRRTAHRFGTDRPDAHTPHATRMDA